MPLSPPFPFFLLFFLFLYIPAICLILRQALTGESCNEDSDCMGERSCLFELEPNNFNNCVSASTEGKCFCFPNTPDQDCKSCSEGEVCAQTPLTPRPICTSSEIVDQNPDFSAVPQPSPTDPEDNICIDANLLSNLAPHQLVFARHGRARVLCDPKASCATAGHMVVWHGRTMMMATYCAVVRKGECREEVRWVNSPRWARRVRVASRTAGLEFTAFAARYATRAEEIVLRMAVRVGL